MNFGQSLKAASHSVNGFARIDTVTHTWADVDVHCDEKYPGPGQTWTDMRSAETTVMIRLEQRGGICEPRFQVNEPAQRRRRDGGFFNWIPPDQKVWCHSDNALYLRDLRLTFDTASVRSIAGDRYDYSKLHEPRLIVYDSRVTRCAHLLAEACTTDVSNGRVYAESITTALLAALLDVIGKRAEEKSMGALARWQLRIAKEYLADNYSDEICLGTLAERTGLSRSRLTRGFKAATGVAPYAWMMQARVQRAQDLLGRKEQPIVDVALELGFADQSHFAKTFKRLTGVTPREWQRAHGWRTPAKPLGQATRSTRK